MNLIRGRIKVQVKNINVRGCGVIILTGPSSCGKGEIAKSLSKFLSISKEQHLSMGEILRTVIREARKSKEYRQKMADVYNISDSVSILSDNRNDTGTIEKAQRYWNELQETYQKENISQLDWLEFCIYRGLLVPDKYTVKIINSFFENDIDTYKNSICILDGYPRTTEAAIELLITLRQNKIPLIKIIHLSITKSEMKKRALGRKRLDDTDENLERRYKFYINHVQPTIDYLKEELGSEWISMIDAHQPVCDHNGRMDLIKSIKNVTKDVVAALGLPDFLNQIE